MKFLVKNGITISRLLRSHCLKNFESALFCCSQHVTNYLKPYSKTEYRRYSASVLRNNTPNDNVSDCDSQLLERLRILVDKEEFDEVSCNSVLQECCLNIKQFSDDELVTLAPITHLLRRKFEKNCSDEVALENLWIALDGEISIRAPDRKAEEIVKLFKVHSYLQLPYKSPFVIEIVKKHLVKILRCDKPVVIQFLSLMNSCRYWNVYYLKKFKLEEYLYTNIDRLDGRELAVILMSIRQTSSSLHTPGLAEKLCQRLVNELANINSDNDYIFRTYLEFIQFQCDKMNCMNSYSATVVPILRFLKKNCHFQVDFYILAAEICVTALIYDDQFLSILASKILAQSSDVNVKNILRALRCLTFFDFHTQPDIYDALLTAFREEPLRSRLFDHPKLLVSIVECLTMVGMYPYDFIDTILSKAFVEQTFGENELLRYLQRHNFIYGSGLLTIDGGVGIECPNYDGNRLDPKIRENIRSHVCWTIPPLLSTSPEDAEFQKVYKRSKMFTKLTYNLRSILEDLLGGREYVHTCYLLSHLHRPNLLCGIDAQQVPRKLSACITEQLIVDRGVLDKDCTWFTFTVMIRSNFEGKAAHVMTEVPKARQLKKLGYETIQLVKEDWYDMSDEEKRSYVKKKIFGTI